MLKLTLTTLTVLLLTFSASTPLRAAEGDLKSDLATLQGKWKATVTTDDGTSKWTLDIKGNKTTFLIETQGGDTVFKGEGQFKLEQFGKFKAYTYSDLKILAGDREGETLLTDGKSKSSAYKLEDDSFTTVSGFSDNDKDKPLLIKWEKAAK